MPNSNADLDDLINEPRETLDVERTCTHKCATSGFRSRVDMPESCGNVAF